MWFQDIGSATLRVSKLFLLLTIYIHHYESLIQLFPQLKKSPTSQSSIRLFDGMEGCRVKRVTFKTEKTNLFHHTLCNSSILSGESVLFTTLQKLLVSFRGASRKPLHGLKNMLQTTLQTIDTTSVTLIHGLVR